MVHIFCFCFQDAGLGLFFSCWNGKRLLADMARFLESLLEIPLTMVGTQGKRRAAKTWTCDLRANLKGSNMMLIEKL